MRTSLVFISLAALVTTYAAPASAADCAGAAFAQNSCSVCATQTLPSGEGDKTISDIIFTWKNTGATQQVIYDNEQSKPQLVLVGSGVTYSANPADPAKFWAWSPSLSWVPYTDYKEYVLDAGKQVDTFLSTSGSTFTIMTEALPEGSPVALVKSTITYHDIDANFEEGPKKEYTACTLYTNAAPVTNKSVAPEPVAKATPALTSVATGTTVTQPPVTIKPVVSAEAKAQITSRMTKVATGPAENILAVTALLLAATIIALRRKSRA